ncbi:MAG: hypothetical protein ABFS35_17560 [Bacteroidota bacterium]
MRSKSIFVIGAFLVSAMLFIVKSPFFNPENRKNYEIPKRGKFEN